MQVIPLISLGFFVELDSTLWEKDRCHLGGLIQLSLGAFFFLMPLSYSSDNRLIFVLEYAAFPVSIGMSRREGYSLL